MALKALTTITPVIAIAATGICPVTASASRRLDSPVCRTPRGQRVDASNSRAVVTQTRPNKSDGDAMLTYDYCLRSTGTEHRFMVTNADVGSVGGDEVIQIGLAGRYLAFSTESNGNSAGDYNSYSTRLVNMNTGNAQTVPEGVPSTTRGLDATSGVSDFVLSSSGMLLALESSFSPDLNAPSTGYLVAFSTTTDRTTVLSSGGSYAHLEIFECTAGCSPTATALAGWTSNGGTEQYAPLPPS